MKITEDHGQSPIILDNITVRLRDKFILPATSWVIEKNQHWAIIGPNGAGKSSLVRALAGELPVVGGKISYPVTGFLQDKICYVSFELHHRLVAREEDLDASRYFSRKLNSYTTALRMILEAIPNSDRSHNDLDHIVNQLEIAYLLNRGIRFLSTGEMRKVMIARALVKSPRFLILDEPFDGLDTSSRSQLAEIINGLMNAERQIILVTHRLAEILPNISHVLGLKDGVVFCQGKRKDILISEQIELLYHRHPSRASAVQLAEKPDDLSAVKLPEVLVEMKNTTVRYKDVIVLDHLNWTMKCGENWALAGPNGSGKTTLLSLIAGDNPQAYANEIYLFGKRRGSGESIWDIKRWTGLVSSEFQIRYRKPIAVRDVILSGFFDSIGLYRQSNAAQRESVANWIEFIHMAQQADRPFSQLSYGEQRLVLLARAMVKLPLLLILDEPCQGLDRTNRRMILDLIDFIGCTSRTQVIYVTHHPEEMPACITHLLRFEKGAEGSYSAAACPI